MKIEIHQIISNVLDLNYNIISSRTHEDYVLYPEANKQLLETRTGKILPFVSVNSKDKINNYIEIDKR